MNDPKNKKNPKNKREQRGMLLRHLREKIVSAEDGATKDRLRGQLAFLYDLPSDEVDEREIAILLERINSDHGPVKDHRRLVKELARYIKRSRRRHRVDAVPQFPPSKKKPRMKVKPKPSPGPQFGGLPEMMKMMKGKKFKMPKGFKPPNVMPKPFPSKGKVFPPEKFAQHRKKLQKQMQKKGAAGEQARRALADMTKQAQAIVEETHKKMEDKNNSDDEELKKEIKHLTALKQEIREASDFMLKKKLKGEIEKVQEKVRAKLLKHKKKMF